VHFGGGYAEGFYCMLRGRWKIERPLRSFQNAFKNTGYGIGQLPPHCCRHHQEQSCLSSNKYSRRAELLHHNRVIKALRGHFRRCVAVHKMSCRCCFPLSRQRMAAKWRKCLGTKHAWLRSRLRNMCNKASRSSGCFGSIFVLKSLRQVRIQLLFFSVIFWSWTEFFSEMTEKSTSIRS